MDPRRNPFRLMMFTLRCCAAFFCILLFAGASISGGKPGFTLAVIPQMPPVAMHKNWSPFVDRLTKDTGFEFRLKLYETMAEFEADYKRGGPDCLYASPPQAVLARKVQGYDPVLRNSKPIAGIVFVKKDSPIRTIQELNGKDVAFVGSRNVCSILIRSTLAEKGMQMNIKKHFAGSTENVFQHVIHGNVDAGGTLDVALGRAMADVQEQVRVIYTTPQIAPHPLSAHPRVPSAVRSAVMNAVFAMQRDPAGKEILRSIQLPSPVRADYARDYQSLETIDIVGLSREE